MVPYPRPLHFPPSQLSSGGGDAEAKNGAEKNQKTGEPDPHNLATSSAKQFPVTVGKVNGSREAQGTTVLVRKCRLCPAASISLHLVLWLTLISSFLEYEPEGHWASGIFSSLSH